MFDDVLYDPNHYPGEPVIKWPRFCLLATAVTLCVVWLPLMFTGMWWCLAAVVVTWIGSVALLSVELVLGCEHTFSRRLLIFGGWIGTGTLLATLPFVIYWPKVWPQLFVVPWLLLSSQFLLWPLRYVFRWRITHDALRAPPKEVWTVRDFFLATLLVALALGATRWWNQFSGLDGISLVRVTILVAIIAPFVLIPAAWYMLRFSDMAWTAGVAVVHFLLLLAAMSGLMMPLVDEFGWRTGVFFGAIAAAALLVGTCTGMACLRTSGYRLIWGRETEWTGAWRDYGGYW